MIDDITTGGENSPILKEEITPCGNSHGSLAAITIADLTVTLKAYNHQPSPAMWAGLNAVAATLQAMADDRCEPSVYVSSLDPGVGKTQLLVHFLRALMRSPHHQGVAAIVCVSRKDQIRSIASEASLDKFAVLTADPELNEMATERDVDRARVLFTTQQMILSRCRFSSFRSASAFHYKGQPRAVRIWDEAILPGEPLAVTVDDLRTLPAELRSAHRGFTAALDDLIDQIATCPDGAQLALPDLSISHHLDERNALLASRSSERATKTIKRLWPLLGRSVTVRRSWGATFAFDYRDNLPADIRPVVVLDASARVRTTYDLWKERRGGLVRLPSAPKDYSGLSIRVWHRGGGKDAFALDASTMAEGIRKTISERVHERWLVICHKATPHVDFEKLVRSKLPSPSPDVSFLTWGRHDATNDFAAVPNVILAGTLFFTDVAYEAIGRLAADAPSSAGAFHDIDRVKLGEHAHGILQAVCRSSVRGYENGGCPATRAYIIASRQSGIPAILPDIFPDAVIEDWHPAPKLKGHQERAFIYIVDRLTAEPQSIVTISDLVRHLNIDPKYLSKEIRKKAAFQAALAEFGISETPGKLEQDPQNKSLAPGFWRPFTFYDFGEED